MVYRDDDGNEIPQYNHGYDSGWDNGTPFDVGFPHEGPDLCAFLVLQMDVLAQIADKLDRGHEAVEWKRRADTLLAKMMDRFWVDGKFVSKLSGTDTWNVRSRSLMSYLPLVLGKRLPVAIRSKLLSDLKASGLLTEYGLATEHPESELYREDGYWRGPVWAPTTWLIADGVDQLGDRAFTREIVRRFCDTCARSGFAENFDPLTGASLQDPAHTWTSSAFIYLAHEYLMDGEP
jgi:glycogen debranching enzyme